MLLYVYNALYLSVDKVELHMPFVILQTVQVKDLSCHKVSSVP